MSDIVVTKKNEGKILCVELNIPQKGNALSLNIIRKLTEFFQAVPKGPAQAVVLSGRGEHLLSNCFG